MSSSQANVGVDVATTELSAVLRQLLQSQYSARRQIVALDRRPLPAQSSFAIEGLDAYLDDGTKLRLLVKDTSVHGLRGLAQHAKPAFLHDPLREIAVYQEVLADACLGTATYYGATIDPQTDRYWLFLEHVIGEELYQVAFDGWLHVARWLASTHDQLAEVARQVQPDVSAHLLRYDRAFYRTWIDRALVFLQRRCQPSAVQQPIERLAAHYDQVIEQLMRLPQTLIHGEFYASNVLVHMTGGVRVCPVDWEMAAIGPGLIDLAALTSGGWSDHERVELAMAYYTALAPRADWPPPPDTFLRALDLCRLHLSIQWLGWSETWEPPAEHAYDWLSEALRLSTNMGLDR
jgi:Phosphotransferase enzyme family